MTRKNRIITHIDFSDNSESLIKFSSEFSEIIGSKIVFVHKVSGVSPTLTDPDIKKQILDTRKEEALDNLKALTKKYFFRDSEFLVSDKDILTILDDLKSDNYFDWVFVGLQGKELLQQIFIGSTALKVIEDSELLCVAVPIQKEIFIPQKLIVGVYYKSPINIAQFNILLSNLSNQIKEIEFITVITENDDEDESINYLLQLTLMYSEYHAVMNPFRGKDTFSEIMDYMANKQDSFLVVQQGSRALTDGLFRKFLINNLVYGNSIPLIVLSK
ncbi:MAG TPA: universal stress protein [Gillisia sp.]|nr:universal stress protein [Gillisia sp.]